MLYYHLNNHRLVPSQFFKTQIRSYNKNAEKSWTSWIADLDTETPQEEEEEQEIPTTERKLTPLEMRVYAEVNNLDKWSFEPNDFNTLYYQEKLKFEQNADVVNSTHTKKSLWQLERELWDHLAKKQIQQQKDPSKEIPRDEELRILREIWEACGHDAGYMVNLLIQRNKGVYPPKPAYLEHYELRKESKLIRLLEEKFYQVLEEKEAQKRFEAGIKSGRRGRHAMVFKTPEPKDRPWEYERTRLEHMLPHEAALEIARKEPLEPYMLSYFLYASYRDQWDREYECEIFSRHWGRREERKRMMRRARRRRFFQRVDGTVRMIMWLRKHGRI